MIVTRLWFAFVVGVATLACGSESTGAEPAFSVTVTVLAVPANSAGCGVMWKADASDPSIQVSYSVSYRLADGRTLPVSTGTFQDTVTVEWLFAGGTFDVVWYLSTATWTGQGSRSVSNCPSSSPAPAFPSGRAHPSHESAAAAA